MPQQLVDAPELPRLGAHIWDWFIELHQARGGGGMGPSPITYGDIVHWSYLTRAKPEPWEVKVLRLIDGAFMQSAAENKE